jgi:hypothetical protein
MPTLSVPFSNTPPYVLLSLALFHNADIAWNYDVTERSEPSYEGVTGTEKVRGILERGLPGKEVSLSFR